jgi:hypothetical protein
VRSRKEELRKRRERNAERRKRFAGADEAFCSEHHSNIFDDTEDDGSAGFWKTIAAFRNVSWGKLSRGYRGRSKAEFISKCGDSLRELEETAYWLELLVDGKIVPPKLLAALRQECDELIAIFVTILKRSKEPFETS